MPTNDRIFIKRLRTHGIIGVYKHEREAPQEILISATLCTDTHPAAHSDSLDDCIDYDVLAKNIRNLVEKAERQTVEALAEDVAQLCLQDQRVKRVRVKVEKPAAFKEAESVGITILRKRNR